MSVDGLTDVTFISVFVQIIEYEVKQLLIAILDKAVDKSRPAVAA